MRRKLRPSTDAYDRTRRDSGSSASTCAAKAPCSEAGIASSEPSSCAAAISSPTNSGLPAARDTTRSISCGRSGAASVASMVS